MCSLTLADIEGAGTGCPGPPWKITQVAIGFLTKSDTDPPPTPPPPVEAIGPMVGPIASPGRSVLPSVKYNYD